MKKAVLNYILPLFSFSSMVIGIEDVCKSFAWRLFIGVVAFALLSYAYVLIKKKAPLSVIATSVISAIILSVTVTIDYKKNEKMMRISASYQEYLHEIDSTRILSKLEREAIINKDARAQFELAKQYLFGREAYPLDYSKAIDFAQRSADQGYAYAHELLANIYLRGRGCEPDTARAVSNMIQALKEGNLNLSRYVLTFDVNNLHLSRKDSLLVIESLQGASYIDSLITSCKDSEGTLCIDSFLQTINSRKKQIRILADKGYSTATELLFFNALLSNKDECHELCRELYEKGRIPDTPTMRGLFFTYLLGPDYESWKSDEEFVEKYVGNQDFMTMAFQSEYISLHNIKDLLLRYKYNLSQFQRAQYLKAHSDELYIPAVILNDDINQDYLFARYCLGVCTDQVTSEMKSKPFVFGNLL